jgi:hypothetical protein
MKASRNLSYGNVRNRGGGVSFVSVLTVGKY